MPRLSYEQTLAGLRRVEEISEEISDMTEAEIYSLSMSLKIKAKMQLPYLLELLNDNEL